MVVSAINQQWKIIAQWGKKSFFKVDIPVKVQIFWEGHKFLKKPSTLFWRYLVISKKGGIFFSNFVALSQYLSFTFTQDVTKFFT